MAYYTLLGRTPQISHVILTYLKLLLPRMKPIRLGEVIMWLYDFSENQDYGAYYNLYTREMNGLEGLTVNIQ